MLAFIDWILLPRLQNSTNLLIVGEASNGEWGENQF